MRESLLSSRVESERVVVVVVDKAMDLSLTIRCSCVVANLS